MLTQLYSVAQAARLLAVSEDLLRKFIARHEIPVVALGRRRLIEQSVLERIVRHGLPPKAAVGQDGAGS
jgi:excisionase family DNA binding protein